MFIRSLVVVGWVGLASLAVNVATAKDALAPGTSSYAISGVNFSDPEAGDFGSRFRVDVSGERGARFSRLNQSNDLSARDRDAMRQVEIALVAGAGRSLPIDVAFAQRAGMSVNEQGDIESQSRGSELRLGRGLANMRRGASSSLDQPAWYFFAASDDEALTWQPGARSSFGGSSARFGVQDRVEIGDMQAGITYEAGGLQASLAYVQREVSVQSGAQSYSEDESFTGLTLTMRH